MNVKLVYLGVILWAALCPSWLAAQSDAAGLFKSKCVMCHAQDGSGNSPTGKALKAKDLRSPETQAKSDSELTAVIANGRDKMPKFGQTLKPEQITALVGYIRQFAKK